MSPLVRFLYVITFSVVTLWSRNFMDFPDFYLAKIDKIFFSLNIVHLNVLFYMELQRKKTREILFTMWTC